MIFRLGYDGRHSGTVAVRAAGGWREMEMGRGQGVVAYVCRRELRQKGQDGCTVSGDVGLVENMGRAALQWATVLHKAETVGTTS
jgi:hypothetical protein